MKAPSKLMIILIVMAGSLIVAPAQQLTGSGAMVATTSGTLNEKYRAMIVSAIDLDHQQPKAIVPPTDPPKPDVIGEALKAEVDASAAFDAARSRLEAAQANTRAVLFREMAEQGIKPSECLATDANGNQNPFACLSHDQKTGAWVFVKKTDAARK